jgi:hypothetical protein
METEKTEVQSQPWANSSQDPISQPVKAGCGGACFSFHLHGNIWEYMGYNSPGQPGHKCETLLEKYLKQKGLGA